MSARKFKIISVAHPGLCCPFPGKDREPMIQEPGDSQECWQKENLIKV